MRCPARMEAPARKSQARRCLQFLAVLSVGVGGSLQAPIPTSCVSQCGENQACVTTCQVCVERSHCSALTDCPSCLEEAAPVKQQRIEAYDDLVVDSGGVPLVLDDTRNRYRAATVAWMATQKDLKEARTTILETQRQVEWSQQEHNESIAKLHEARQHLKNVKMKFEKWTDSEEKLVRHLRATAAHLQKEKDDVEQEEKEVGVHNDIAKRALDRAHAVAEKDIGEEERKGRLMSRGLEEEVHAATDGLKTAIDDAHNAHALEQLAAGRFDRAKKDYANAAMQTSEAEKNMLELQAQMESLSMPNVSATHVASNATNATYAQLESRTLRAASPLLVLGVFVMISAV